MCSLSSLVQAILENDHVMFEVLQHNGSCILNIAYSHLYQMKICNYSKEALTTRYLVSLWTFNENRTSVCISDVCNHIETHIDLYKKYNGALFIPGRIKGGFLRLQKPPTEF